MEAVILKTVSIGTIDYTSGIMKDRIENFYNIFDDYESRSHSPFMGRGMVVHKCMKKLRDINYSYLAFGKNLKEFNGFLGNFKNVGEDVWIDTDDGRPLGNFELDNPKYNEVIFKEGQALLIITLLTEVFCLRDLEIIIGYPDKDYTHDGYFHQWYYDNDTKLWDQKHSDYYCNPNLIDFLENDSNPLLIISVDMRDAGDLFNYIQQKIERLGKISIGEKLFDWKY